ncbi:MAG: beta-N-acetylhexosaminidase [Sulfitobacter sp.]|nr:beta-N-acetylhexosaminidase [Sulfitobacter sp.]
MRFGASILDAEGLRLSGDEKALFRDCRPFGFILFARNIESVDQVRALCDEMRDAAGHEALITIDQEGGRVQRLRAPLWREWLPPLDLVTAAGADAPEALRIMYRLIAAELHDLGVDSNCAPMVDLITEGTHDFLRNRCYGSDPARVAQLGRAVAEGLLAGGVLPILKHIPGHGRATLDSHFDLPRVAAPLDDLMATDFAPFAALSDLPMGMTAHLVYEDIDATAPATCSPEVMRVVREEIGFDNLIMTDDLSMKALSGSHVESTRAALSAGCDVALYCNQPLADRAAVAEAAGEMTETAQIRAERALACRRNPDDIDIPALTAKLDALTGGALNG